jgi:hypothetical protein
VLTTITVSSRVPMLWVAPQRLSPYEGGPQGVFSILGTPRRKNAASPLPRGTKKSFAGPSNVETPKNAHIATKRDVSATQTDLTKSQ